MCGGVRVCVCVGGGGVFNNHSMKGWVVRDASPVDDYTSGSHDRVGLLKACRLYPNLFDPSKNAAAPPLCLPQADAPELAPFTPHERILVAQTP